MKNLRLKHKILGGSIALLGIILLASGASILSIDRVSHSVYELNNISAESRLTDSLVAQLKDITAKVKDYAQRADVKVAATIREDFTQLTTQFEVFSNMAKSEKNKNSLAEMGDFFRQYKQNFQQLYNILQERRTLLEDDVLAKANKISADLAIISEQTQLSGDSSSALSSAAVRGHFLNTLINLNAYLRTREAEQKLEYTNALANFKEEADLLELYLSSDAHIALLKESLKTTQSMKDAFENSEKMFDQSLEIIDKIEKISVKVTGKVEILNGTLQHQQQIYQTAVGKDFQFFKRLSWGLMFLGAGLALLVSWYVTSSTSGVVNNLSQLFLHMFETVKSVGNHASSVVDNSVTMERSSKNVQSKSEEIANNTSKLASNISEVSVAVEEMDYSITEIAKNIQQSVMLVEQTANYATDASEVIKKLESASTQINDVIGLINGLAEQTNLLALNASIEAARAGDAGRGFAVVADEVKKLATQTSDATDTISSQVEAMQKISADVVHSITQILESIHTIQTNTQGISNTIEEQKKASSVVSGNMHTISDGTTHASEEVVNIKQEAIQNGELAANLTRAAQEMRQQSANMQKDATSFLTGLQNL